MDCRDNCEIADRPVLTSYCNPANKRDRFLDSRSEIPRYVLLRLPQKTKANDQSWFEISTTEMAPPNTNKPGRSALADVVAREYTIHLHKRIFGASFKKRAPLAIKEIKSFAKTAMVRYPRSIATSSIGSISASPIISRHIWGILFCGDVGRWRCFG